MARIERIIRKIEGKFAVNGSFNLLQGEQISSVVAQSQVPNSFGIYIVFDHLDCTGDIIYIGKAGTIRQDGTKKLQGIARRLCKKQGGVSRNLYFNEFMNSHSLPGLSVSWYETFSNTETVLPAHAETYVLQEYYDLFGNLPLLNKSI